MTLTQELDPHFGDYYGSLGARGKHRYVAVSDGARKLCERRPYEPRSSAQSRQKQPNQGRVPLKPGITSQTSIPQGLVSARPETTEMRIIYPIFGRQSSIQDSLKTI